MRHTNWPEFYRQKLHDAIGICALSNPEAYQRRLAIINSILCQKDENQAIRLLDMLPLTGGYEAWATEGDCSPEGFDKFRKNLHHLDISTPDESAGFNAALEGAIKTATFSK